MSNKFNVGDIIIGNETANEFYSTTSEGVVCEVLQVFNDGSLYVLPIKDKDGKKLLKRSTQMFLVSDNCFNYYTTQHKNNSNNLIENTITIQEYTEFKSAGKGSHKGYTIDKIKTTVNVNGKTGVAVVNKEDYDERQGILEALGNMIYGNFDREYDKLIHKRQLEYKASCKCSICGKYNNTPEDARTCEKIHEDKRHKKFEAYVLRKEAIKRIKEADKENKIEEIMIEIYEKRKKENEKNDNK